MYALFQPARMFVAWLIRSPFVRNMSAAGLLTLKRHDPNQYWVFVTPCALDCLFMATSPCGHAFDRWFRAAQCPSFAFPKGHRNIRVNENPPEIIAIPNYVQSRLQGFDAWQQWSVK